MIWLVTGGSGFLGRHILDAARSRAEEAGHRVVAIGRTHPGGWPVEDYVRADLDDPRGWASAIRRIAPDVMIHAAGKTPPASSWSLYWSNTRATAFLLESLSALDRPCRVVLVGSAAELGPVPTERLPVGEDQPCRPIEAYGLSKWAATRLGLATPAPLEVISGRVFNPIGPGLPLNQAFGRFASLLTTSPADPVSLPVGGLDVCRDFIDVRDAAEALVILAEKGRGSTVYHIGTGESHSIEEGLRFLITLSGRKVNVESAGAGRGPSDSRADIRRIVSETGWRPRIAWEQSLRDLWNEAHRRAAPRYVA